MCLEPVFRVREHHAAGVGLQNLKRLRLQRQLSFRHPLLAAVDRAIRQPLVRNLRLHGDLPVDLLPLPLAIRPRLLAPLVFRDDPFGDPFPVAIIEAPRLLYLAGLPIDLLNGIGLGHQ